MTRIGLPALGRLVSPDWGEVGRFLGPNIEEFARTWLPERWPRRGARPGSAGVASGAMSFGAGVVMWGARPRGR